MTSGTHSRMAIANLPKKVSLSTAGNVMARPSPWALRSPNRLYGWHAMPAAIVPAVGAWSTIWPMELVSPMSLHSTGAGLMLVAKRSIFSFQSHLRRILNPAASRPTPKHPIPAQSSTVSVTVARLMLGLGMHLDDSPADTLTCWPNIATLTSTRSTTVALLGNLPWYPKQIPYNAVLS